MLTVNGVMVHALRMELNPIMVSKDRVLESDCIGLGCWGGAHD